MSTLQPNVNRGRQQLAGVLTRVMLSGLDPEDGHEVIAEAVDLVLGALDGYLVSGGELVACSDEEILDATAKLSASLRVALEIPVEAR